MSQTLALKISANREEGHARRTVGFELLTTMFHDLTNACPSMIFDRRLRPTLDVVKQLC
jgi:hypothetical protein